MLLKNNIYLTYRLDNNLSFNFQLIYKQAMFRQLNKKFVPLFFIFPLSIANAQNNMGRMHIPINDNWKFRITNSIYKKNKDTIVTLPYTWNAKEVLNPTTNYQRATGYYSKKIKIDNSWLNKRVFLYFEGANSVANVFVNKMFVGEHKGGYTKFCYEITQFLNDSENVVSVLVCNNYRPDVIPESGDFNIYGGLHRPVSLIVTEKNCITPLDFASSGVYITPTNITDKSADINVKVKLSLIDNNRQAFKLHTTIYNQKNEVVSTQISGVNDDVNISKQLLSKPHLWNGKEDPYLYRLKVELMQNEVVIDTISQSFGIRTYKVDKDKGFFLNGKYLDLHGVAYHEDVAGKGSAYTKDDYENDMTLFKELGLTVLRFAHYPHGEPSYDLADKNGIAVETEIPFVGPGPNEGTGYINSEDLRVHIRNCLTELIRQNYNHPSIFFWGLFNELTAKYDNPASFVKELSAIAHSEDPSRLTSCADETDVSTTPFDTVSDVKAYNRYYGWYGGKVTDLENKIESIHKQDKLAFGISEYGAGASIHQHTDTLFRPNPTSRFHPEEWQTYFHETQWGILKAKPYVWGKFIWVFADFGSTNRTEGDTLGINDKGLLTYNKKTKKDAFYFYKANWNTTEPTLYITDRRNTLRHLSTTNIKVYCTLPSAELFVNGKSLGKKSPDDLKRIVWENVELQAGTNTIEVKAGKKGNEMTDSCVWELRF